MVKRSLLLVGTAVLAAGVAVPLPARAEPDRHMPDLSAGYCPGGKGGRYNSPVGHGWCDGTPFPDGSYWHSVQPNHTAKFTIECVINPDGWLTPKPAPPGGCGGAV